MVNMISGGLHAGGNLDIQDVLIIPVGASSYSEALEMIVALYRAVGAVLKERGFESALVGDEGGYGPRLRNNEQAFEIVVDADRGVRLRARPRRRDRRRCGLDPLLRPGPRHLSPARRPAIGSSTAAGMIDLLAGWVEQYPIVSIEDGLAEDDWAGWTALTARLGGSVQFIGDDLFATQVARLRQGIERRAGNADPDQAQPGRDAHRDLRRAPTWPARTASARSSRPARARPRTRRSPTWPSPPRPARSRSARWRARSGSPSTIACSASRRPWVRTPPSRGRLSRVGSAHR